MKVRAGQEATAFRGSAFDLKLGLEFYECLGVEAGMTHINGSGVDDSPNHPFGGENNSGIGRFGGEWAIKQFTTDHWVTVQHTPRSYPF
jgi:acyl-CoA reductase-like NAD-dependent aldehyde dehydrogenase